MDFQKNRKETTTDLSEILLKTIDIYTSNYWIKITDNLRPESSFEAYDIDSFDAWYDDIARVHQWKTERIGDKPKEKWNPFKDTDIQLKTENKKNAVAESKPKTEAIPPVAIFALGAAMQNGSYKYGAFNWRDSAVDANVFYNAMMRHLLAWYAGENYAEDSGVHHLAHLMASCAIILDAENYGVFVDNRFHSNTMDLYKRK